MAGRGLGASADNPRLAERAALMMRACKRDIDRDERRGARGGAHRRRQRRPGRGGDDPHTLRFVRDTLGEAGYAPLVTGASADLARMIRAERPALALLDLLLPGRDGMELLAPRRRLGGNTDGTTAPAARRPDRSGRGQRPSARGAATPRRAVGSPRAGPRIPFRRRG